VASPWFRDFDFKKKGQESIYSPALLVMDLNRLTSFSDLRGYKGSD
jgi:hypothetical protein